MNNRFIKPELVLTSSGHFVPFMMSLINCWTKFWIEKLAHSWNTRATQSSYRSKTLWISNLSRYIVVSDFSVRRIFESHTCKFSRLMTICCFGVEERVSYPTGSIRLAYECTVLSGNSVHPRRQTLKRGMENAWASNTFVINGQGRFVYLTDDRITVILTEVFHNSWQHATCGFCISVDVNAVFEWRHKGLNASVDVR